MKKKTILIIDGQGGRLGVLLTERMKAALPDFSITAVGTNTIATAAMLRAGADHGATGEYPVICAAEHAAYIVGPVGIAIPASLTGEVTPSIAEAVGRSLAEKILIPGDKCAIHVVGTSKLTLGEYADMAVKKILELETAENANKKGERVLCTKN